MRQLLIFLLVLFGIWWLRRALRKPDDDNPAGSGGREQRRQDDGPERMLACAHCGIHVPESEGVQSGGHFYCCEEHRRLGPGR